MLSNEVQPRNIPTGMKDRSFGNWTLLRFLQSQNNDVPIVRLFMLLSNITDPSFSFP